MLCLLLLLLICSWFIKAKVLLSVISVSGETLSSNAPLVAEVAVSVCVSSSWLGEAKMSTNTWAIWDNYPESRWLAASPVSASLICSKHKLPAHRTTLSNVFISRTGCTVVIWPKLLGLVRTHIFILSITPKRWKQLSLTPFGASLAKFIMQMNITDVHLRG